MNKAEKQKCARQLVAEHVHFLTGQERIIQKIVDKKCDEMDKRIEQIIDRKIEEKLRS